MSASAQASSMETPFASAMVAHTRRSSSAADVDVAGACLSVSIKTLESGTTLRTSGIRGGPREGRNGGEKKLKAINEKNPASALGSPRARGRGQGTYGTLF